MNTILIPFHKNTSVLHCKVKSVNIEIHCFPFIIFKSMALDLMLYRIRFTHRVVRGVMIAVGRPDGRLCCLAKSESAILLACKQAAFIQNPAYDGPESGPDIVSLGHNPFTPNMVLHCIALYLLHCCVPLHLTQLFYTAAHYTALHCSALLYTTIYCTARQYTKLH